MKMNDKFTIAYYIYNKGPFVKKIVECARQYDGIPLIFLFDGCTDDSVAQFQSCRSGLKNCRVFVNQPHDLFETLCNNFILETFETESCVLCQDDLLPNDTKYLDLAIKIQNEDPDTGLIGFKDGFEMSLVNSYDAMISAPWSFSKSRRQVLEAGEFVQRTFVNRGPLLVNKRVIERIGLFDRRFVPMFWDDNDYCLRAVLAGFHNYVAFSDVECKPEWGATRGGSKIPCKKIFLANEVRFGRKWNMPMPKQYPLKVISAFLASLRIQWASRVRSAFSLFVPKEI